MSGNVLFGFGVAAPKGVRAVPLEERLEFQRKGLALALGQHEVHPALAGPHLPGRLKSQNIRAERGEKVLGGGFGLGAVLEVEDILLNGRVGGNGFVVGGQREKFDAFASDQLTQGVEDFGVIHGH